MDSTTSYSEEATIIPTIETTTESTTVEIPSEGWYTSLGVMK